MSVKYRKIPKESTEDVQRRAPKSESSIDFGGIATDDRRASLPPEYSKLHGFLQRLSNRRRATSEKRTSNKDLEEESPVPSPHESHSGDEDCKSSRKYTRMRHAQLYRSQSDDVFNNIQNSTVLVN